MRSKTLVRKLMRNCSRAETAILTQIAGKLQSPRFCSGKKKWCNIKKADDTMFSLIVARCGKLTAWKSTSIRRFVRESFKARALCLTSERYRSHAGSRLPTDPVPSDARVYHIYGYDCTDAKIKHKRWSKEWLQWGHMASLSYKRKLDDATLAKHTTAGSFVRLQVLSDAAEAFGTGLVKLPKGFGNGVRLEGRAIGEDLLVEIKDELNKHRQFLRMFRGSISLFQTAHLICECRQYVWSYLPADRLRAFFKNFDTGTTSTRSTREDIESKREACQSIANFALG